MASYETPDRFGRYQLLEQLGEGGSGAVYLAERDDAPGRRVALKVLHPGVAIREKELRRFLREAEIGRALFHPHLVPVLDVDRVGRAWLIAIEYIDGFALSDVTSGEARLSFSDRVAVAAQVADALAYLHEHGIIHRDVKPRNVLVRAADRHAFLIDLGLARDLTRDSSLTGTDAIFGTPWYMSPEQLEGRNGSIGPASDVYSLGATIHELFAGVPPFKADTIEGQRRVVAEDEPPHLKRLRPDVPDALQALVLNALEKRPEHRPTAATIRDELRRIERGETPLGHPPVRIRRYRRWLSRRRLELLAVGLAVVALLAFGLYQTNRAQAHAIREHEIRFLLDQSRIDLENGELQNAIRGLRDAIDRDPDDPEGYLHLAFVLSELSRWNEATRAVDDARQRGFVERTDESATARELFCAGLARMVARDWRESERLASEAVRRDPNFFPAYLAQFRCRRELRDPRARESLLRYRDSLRRSSPTHRFVEARLHELSGDYEQAAAMLDALNGEDLDPLARIRLDSCLGRIYLNLGRDSDAVECLTRAARDNPLDGAARVNLALALLRVGRLDDAARSVREGRDIDPHLENGIATVLAGLAWYKRADDEAGAIESLAEALDGNHAVAGRLVAAQRELDRGMDAWISAPVEDAFPHFDRAVEIDPDLVQARSLVGQGLWLSGQLDRALVEFETAHAARSDAPPESPGLRAWRRMQSGVLPNATQLIDVSRFAIAVTLGRRDVAADVWPDVAALAERPDGLDPANALNLAEALVQSRIPEFKDCALARRLVRLHGLRQRYSGQSESIAILDTIDAACP